MAWIQPPGYRECDICHLDMTTGKGYQFPIPSRMIDNKDAALKTADTSLTDVCPACLTTKAAEIVAALVAKAEQT